MELEGTIVQYIGRQQGTSKAGREWKKDEYVLETPGTYPRKVKFHVFGDKADQMRFEMGKAYRLQVDLESREFNGRWYTDVNCFSAQEAGAQAPGAMEVPPMGGMPADAAFGAAPGMSAPSASPFGAPAGQDSTDDLPF